MDRVHRRSARTGGRRGRRARLPEPAAGEPPGANQASTSPPTSSTAPATETPAPAPASAVATAVPIPTLGPTSTSGTPPNFVVASPSGRQLYVASPKAGAIYVVDTAADQVTGDHRRHRRPSPVPCLQPRRPHGVHQRVGRREDHRGGQRPGHDDATDRRDDPGAHPPVPGAVSPDGKRVYVPNHDTGTVSVIDARPTS